VIEKTELPAVPTSAFEDGLADEALDRPAMAAASASLNACGPGPSRPGAAALPARQT